MSKKTIVIICLAVFLAGVLIVREFVLYTTMPKEGVMQMIEPKPEKDSETIKVNSNGAITFLLSADGSIYYYTGAFNGIISKTDFTKVGELVNKYNTEINVDDLMFIIKSAPGSTFKNAIDILDEMTINNVPAGHYAETEITEEEIECIKKIKTNK